jgi:hypothetical protein
MMVVSVSGTVDGHILPARGCEVDLPDHVAMSLCESKQAVPLITEPVKEEKALAAGEDVEERGQTAKKAAPKKAAEKTAGKESGGN